MIYVNGLVGHFCTINKHKILVMEGCFKVGLYKQGLLHDLSKYTPIEFMTGLKYYQGTRSPNAAEKEAIGYSKAWLHHKGRNRHHFEYWIDYGVNAKEGLIGNKMPFRYVVEMFLDRIAACKVYKGDDFTTSSALEYYDKNEGHYVMHKQTKKQLEYLLKMYEKYGEDKTYAYIRKVLIPKAKKKKVF